MIITQTNFEGLRTLAAAGQEGLVLLGTGGNLEEWVYGVTDVLKKEGIAKPNFEFTAAMTLNTTGGRTDMLLLPDWKKVDMGKLALWRIRWGACSWLSDYIVNYADQHEIGWPVEMRDDYRDEEYDDD